MKTTNNKKAKRGGYVKPEINSYTIETTYLMSGSGGSGSGEEIVEPVPGPGEGGLWHGELD